MAGGILGLVQGCQDVGPMTLSGYSEDLKAHLNPGLAVPVSAVMDYLYCPRLAYLRYVRRVPRPPLSRAQLRGILLHKVLGSVMLRERAITATYVSTDSLKRVGETYLETGLETAKHVIHRYGGLLSEAGVGVEEAMAMVEEALMKRVSTWARSLSRFSKRTSLSGEALARAFIPHRAVEVRVEASEIGLSNGVVDVLENGYPMEIKTGLTSLKAHTVQVTVYALMLEHMWEKPVGVAYINYVCVPSFYRVHVTYRLRAEAIQLKRSVIELFAEEATPRHPQRCDRKCGYRKYCIEDKLFTLISQLKWGVDRAIV